MHGGTQNQNETINGMIWQHATKETHSSLSTVETATFLAVCNFNDGSKSLISVLKQLGIVPGVHCERSCEKLDNDRIRNICRCGSSGIKEFTTNFGIINFKGYST